MFEKNMIVCSLPRVHCSDEEWQEAQECAEDTNMSFEEFLEELGKVVEAHYKVDERDKVEMIKLKEK